jgi:tetratricopeptide (TPR) repeat protein
VLRDQAARRTETEREANTALEEAGKWQHEGRLPEALAAARRAASVANTGDAGDAFRQRVQGRRADLELVAELEEARVAVTAHKEDLFGDELADRRFAAAFQKAGLDVEALRAEEAAERIRQSSVVAELAAALDHWALIRHGITRRSDPSFKHLLRVARAADPDRWRDRMREALEREDLQALEALAKSEEVLGQPTLTLALLGRALVRMGAAEPAEALLQQARLGRPEDFWINHDLALAISKAQPARWDDVIRFFTAAEAVRPQSPGAHANLGLALFNKGRLDEAVAECQQAIRLEHDFPEAHRCLGNAFQKKGRLDDAIAEFQVVIRLNKDYPDAHNDLGIALVEKGQLDDAIVEFQEAIRLNKDILEAHMNLGNALCEHGRLDDAIAAYEAAIRLKPDLPEAHRPLGLALRKKGQLDEAIAEYQEAIHLKQDFPEAHADLGNALAEKGQLEKAIAEFQEAIQLKKDYPEAHCNLGIALFKMGRPEQAITEYKEAIRFKKDFPQAHYNLGIALRDRGLLEEAVAANREAIRFKQDYAEAHCNLGHILKQKGHFADALAALKRGHELGSQNPRWSYPSAQWVRTAEQLVALEPKLPKMLKGEAQPADPAEGLVLARMCQDYKKLYAAATRFYAEAFAAEPKLAGDLAAQYRYNAACAAALAGCGQGLDAGQLDDQERARLRRQALDWLRADLTQYAAIVDKGPAQARAGVQQRLEHWQQDTDFAGVRGNALAKLPEAERAPWQKLWAEVEGLRQRAAKAPEPASSSRP